MGSPLVSIVIPCFNAGPYIADAVSSALGQTYQPVEVVVIDDGSTDRSPDVIQSFGNRIRWETQPNRGACAARNRGIELTNGEFVQFLDADDWLHEDKLLKQVPLALEDDSTLVFCDGQSSSSDWSHPHHKRCDPCHDSVVFMLRAGLQTTAPLHRRSWLERVGGWNELLPCSQERDLHLRIAAHGIQFCRLAEVLFTVRHLPNSVSSSYTRVMDQHCVTAKHILEILRNHDSLTDTRLQAIAAFLARDARVYLHNGDSEKSREYFRLAASIHKTGGLNDAYRPLTRLLVKLLGPRLTENLVAVKRGLSI